MLLRRGDNEDPIENFTKTFFKVGSCIVAIKILCTCTCRSLTYVLILILTVDQTLPNYYH